MNPAERDQYLDRWSGSCFLCKEEGVSRDKMNLVRTVIPIKDLPAHAAGAVSKYVMVCNKCKGEIDVTY